MWPVFHGSPELCAHLSPGLLVLSMQRVLRSAACWAVRMVPIFQEAVLPREVGGVGCLKAAPSTTEVPGGGRACTFRSSRCLYATGTWSSASLFSKRSDGGSPLYGEGFSVALGSCWGLC